MNGTPDFFATLSVVRRTIRDAVTPTEGLAILLPLLDDDAVLREFFKALDDAEWIRPLYEQGFFRSAPPREEVEGGGIRSNPWAQSGYLVRMAPRAPDEVAQVLAQVETDNWIVAHDIVDAAKAMPAQSTALLVPKINSLMEDPSFAHLRDGVGEIAAALTRGGEPDAAFELVGSSFAITPETPTNARARIDDYSYLKGLSESVIPTLMPVRPHQLLALLVPWLAGAIEVEHGPVNGGPDHSYIWRPAIEDHAANNDYDLAAQLVTVVRDAFEQAIRENLVTFDEALAIIGDHDSPFLKRLRVHLIAEFADRQTELACHTMLDHSLFDDYSCKHEYARLMRMRFGLLSVDKATEWLDWIEAGPPGEDDRDDETGESELADDRKRHWQIQRLHWIQDLPDGPLKELHDGHFATEGVEELSDFNMHFGGAQFVGHESPYTLEQLQEMGFASAVDVIAEWRPDGDGFGYDRPSVEGLAKVFHDLISADVLAASKQVNCLLDRPSPYVKAFIDAMRDAVNSDEQIDLASVLELCQWVVSRPLDEITWPGVPEDALENPGWKWCRNSIADFLQRVLEAKNESNRPRYRLEHRETLWSVIAPLQNASTESNVLRADAERDPRITDWLLLAMNSPKGRAFHAMFAYADWIGRHKVDDRREERTLPGGFENMPEVRDLLEAQLTDADDYFTARAVYGWRLGLLYWIDHEWLQQHADAIFDLTTYDNDPTKAYGWAAWNSFLFANRPLMAFYELLPSQFSYAVDQAATLDAPQENRENPFPRLGMHLMLLYGRGNLGATWEEASVADDSVLKRLISKSHESVRTHAIEFVGSSVRNEEGDLPPEVTQRFMDLWEYYWPEVGEDDARRNPASAAFGYWFSYGAFDEAWSIEQLERFVAAAPRAEPDNMIMDRLAEICHVDPLRSARIVGILVDGDDQRWRVSSWNETAKAVLTVAMNEGGEARNEAEQVIDRLGRRGFLDFEELLGEQPEPA